MNDIANKLAEALRTRITYARHGGTPTYEEEQAEDEALAALDATPSPAGRVVTEEMVEAGRVALNREWPKPDTGARDVARAVIEAALAAARQGDGHDLSGDAITECRKMIVDAGLPDLAFFDDCVGNVIAHWKKAEAEIVALRQEVEEKTKAVRFWADQVSQLQVFRDDLKRQLADRDAIINGAARAWAKADLGLAWEGAIDNAMVVAVIAICDLRKQLDAEKARYGQLMKDYGQSLKNANGQVETLLSERDAALAAVGEARRVIARTFREIDDQQENAIPDWLMPHAEEMEALLANLPAQSDVSAERTAAEADVLAERRRQVEKEGRTALSDDQYTDNALANAAAAYALSHRFDGQMPNFWPWPGDFWKPKSRRHDLVRAGALIIAEIERLDRAAKQQLYESTRRMLENTPAGTVIECESPECMSRLMAQLARHPAEQQRGDGAGEVGKGTVPCPFCGGDGLFRPGVPCPACNGVEGVSQPAQGDDANACMWCGMISPEHNPDCPALDDGQFERQQMGSGY